MWMGWVSPRLGERSITCEPKGEEIRGGARRTYRNEVERRRMVEYCGTRAGIPLVFLPPTRRILLLSSSPFVLPPFSSLLSICLCSPGSCFPTPTPNFAVSRTAGSLRYSFPLASYVRNEPQLIHHNRFTCMSAGNFHRVLPLSLSLFLSVCFSLSLTSLLRCPRCCCRSFHC